MCHGTLDSRKDCGLYFVQLHFYLYWETTKIVARDAAKTVARDAAKNAACVFWIPAKTAACF